jgi:hypothetical protein
MNRTLIVSLSLYSYAEVILAVRTQQHIKLYT